MTKRETKIIHTNQGYWDGVADRENGKLASWYRGAAKSFGHFNTDYAKGYDIGVFGGEAPPFAIV